MSNIILSSAENSSLLQTLNQSESKVIPVIYSTPTVYAPSATSWYTITRDTGSASSGQSESFSLPKYGFLEQMIFSYNKTVSFTAGGNPADTVVSIPAGDVFNVIDRVELVSSSRILFVLYSEDIIAQLKDLSTDEYATVSNNLVKSATTAAGDASISVDVAIPIVFNFMKGNTMPNLSFSEPMQLRVVYRDTTGLRKETGTNPTNITSTITSKLTLRYKMYSEQDNAQLLASNYEEEQLNQLVHKCYRENPVSHTPSADVVGDYKFEIEVKNVDVCNNFYLMVRGPSGLAEGADQNELLKINRVRLTASGQELCDLTANELLYMKLSHSGWPVNSSYLSSQMADPVAINNVAKVQFGIWSYDKDIWSNGVSLREMNNVLIEVYVPNLKANKKYTCYCQEETSCILSQSSNTGRNIISLVN